MAVNNFLKLENINKVYPDGFKAVSNINFSINKGQFVTILGPSGCGKTTILKMIAGFEDPTIGRILVDGVDIKNLPIHKRSTATVFQDYALFPNMNVYQNIAYGLKVMRKPLEGLSKIDKRKEDRVYDSAAKVANKQIKEIDKDIEKVLIARHKFIEKIENYEEYELIMQIKTQKDYEKAIKNLDKKMHRAYRDPKLKLLKFNFRNRVIVRSYRNKLNPTIRNRPIEFDYRGLNEYQIMAYDITKWYWFYLHINNRMDYFTAKINKLENKRSYWQNYPEQQWEKYRDKFTTRKLTKKEIDNRVKKAIEMVGLTGSENKMPSDMSGGMQQRVALARAIVVEPQILLLDEPLSALDAKIRQQMQLELKRIHNQLGLTFILVTHDQSEALFLSNKVIVMSKGKIQQVDTPKKIYESPANLWVANFIGQANILTCEYLGNNKAKFRDTIIEFSSHKTSTKFNVGSKLSVMVRPEDIEIITNPSPKSKMLAKVIQASYMGSIYNVVLKWKNRLLKVETKKHVEVNQKVGVKFDPSSVYALAYKGEISEAKENAQSK